MSKVILITGASSGFGRLTALELLAKGHTVYATMRDINAKNATAASELRQKGAQVLELDVTSDQSVNEAIGHIKQYEEKIDVLVNNAGIAAAGISESFAPTQVQAVFDVNVIGLFRVTKAVLPLMRARHDGLIINIGSILGRVTFPFYGLYGASKYAVEAISDSLSLELSQLGVEVSLIQPSAYPTNMYASALHPADDHVAEQYGDVAEVPTGIGNTIASMFEGENAPQPSDVANAVVTLVDTTRGQRPNRVVVGTSFGADAANESIQPIQSQLIDALGLGFLKDVKV